MVSYAQLMNQVLKPFLGRFIVIYFDDIMTYSRSENDHEEHLRKVLEAL